MDDKELEASISRRLHDRFDGASAPSGLAAAINEGFAAKQTAKLRFTLRPRSQQLGWATVAAVLVLGSILVLRNGAGPAGPRATATPASIPASTAPASTSRTFVVLPPPGADPSKTESVLASEVLGARLRALGFGNFSSGGGYAISFEVPLDGPSDASSRRVLAATGDVAFVPLPPADYADGKLTPELGKPLPKDEPALFGWEGIASVDWGTNQQGGTTLDFKLKPAAASAFGDYTASNVMGTIAIVLDGRVALLPQVNEPIRGGEVQIASGELAGSAGETSFAETGAILIGGLLPESWRGASVPEIVAKEAAVATALRLYPTADLESAGITSRQDEQGTRAIWWIVVGGDLPPTCLMLRPGATVCPAPEGDLVVVVDAVTGEVIQVDSNG